MENWREGAIYHWYWNDVEYSKKTLERQAGTLYWCCNNIGIVNPQGVLVDTYWNTDSNNKRFTQKDCEMRLDLEYVCNMDELEPAKEYMRVYYLDEDCVDLNHPISTRRKFYIKKGAKKNLDKMRKIIERNIKTIESEISSQLRDIERNKNLLENLNEDTLINVQKRTSMFDDSYFDREEL